MSTNIFKFYRAKSFGLIKQDCKTISMDTGIQNGSLGLLLIFGFFNVLGGMALATFWGKKKLTWKLIGIFKSTHQINNLGGLNLGENFI